MTSSSPAGLDSLKPWASLEPSAINFLVNHGGRAEAVHARLDADGMRPAITIHTIYELAKTFLGPSGNQRGIDLFRVVRRLQPVYLVPASQLLEMERLLVRTWELSAGLLARVAD